MGRSNRRICPGDLVTLPVTFNFGIELHGTRQMLVDDVVGEIRPTDVGLVLATAQTGLRLLVLNSRGELGWAWADRLEPEPVQNA